MVGAVAGLNTGGPRFAGDNGAADPHIAAVLAAYGAGQESEQAVLTALAGSRLLVPLVEAPPEAPEVAGTSEVAGASGATETTETTGATETAGVTGATGACATGDAHDDGCDHRAARELAFPTLIGRDGRPALLAFTSLAALMSWRPAARPVPTPAEQVWGTAVADSSAVVIDVAGPVPIAVDGARLAALAAGAPPPDPHNDPDLQADVAAALASLPAAASGPVSNGSGSTGPGSAGPSVVGAELAAGPDGTDLAVRLLIRPAPPAPQNTPASRVTEPATQQTRQEAVQHAMQQAAEAIAGRLASRLRRGIQFSAALAPATSAPAAVASTLAAPATTPAAPTLVTAAPTPATPAAPTSAATTPTSATPAPAVSPAPVSSRPHG